MKRVCLLALVASCYTSHHTTHVRRGWHGSVESAIVHATKQDGAPQPLRQTGYDVIGTLGYGWRFFDDRIGLLAEVTLPVKRFTLDITSDERSIYPTGNFFIQRDDVLNYGVGVAAGYIPSIYAQTGKTWRLDRCNAYSIDGGVALLLAPSALDGPDRNVALGGFALVTRELLGIDIGAWVDVIRYKRTDNICRDCEDVYAKYRVAVGVLIRGVYLPRKR